MTDSIRDRARLRQIKTFRGLKFERGIAPTDIDAFLDFGGRLFVFVETKYGVAELPKGQQRALERLCDACASQGRTSVLLLTSHSVVHGDIDLATTLVERIRRDETWIDGGRRPLRVVIDALVRRYVPELAEPRVRETDGAPPSRPGPRKTGPRPERKRSSAG